MHRHAFLAFAEDGAPRAWRRCNAQRAGQGPGLKVNGPLMGCDLNGVRSPAREFTINSLSDCFEARELSELVMVRESDQFFILIIRGPGIYLTD